VLQECDARQQELDKFLGSIVHEMRNPYRPSLRRRNCSSAPRTQAHRRTRSSR
jgi:hypothetical protein